MSRIDEVSAEPASTGQAATDEPRTTTTTQEPERSALERALAALDLDESDLDDGALDGEAEVRAAGVDVKKWRQLRALKDHHGGLKAQETDLASAVKELERELVRQYGDAGVRSLTIDDYTGALSCRTWIGPAEGVDGGTLAAAMQAEGGEWAALAPARYNAQSLSSHVNALDEQGVPLPDEIEALIKRSDVWSVGFRKAARGKGRGKRVPTSGD